VDWLPLSSIILASLLGICLLLAVPMVRRRSLGLSSNPSEFGLEFEEISFVTEDDITLRGYWIPRQGSTRAVIMLHGFAGSLDPDLRYTPHLHNAGFNVLMFDFRAHGRSGGRVTSLGAMETRDVRAAVNFTRGKGCDRIGLLGFSMGGRAAIMAAPSTPEVKAILVDGTPPRLVTAVTQNLCLRKVPLPISWLTTRLMLLGASLLTGSNLFSHDPLFAASRIAGIPLLFFHGEKDRYAPANQVCEMVERAGPHAGLWLVPEAKHRDIEDTRPAEYLQKLTAFFTENL
jgi:pimeloyl-ACP methyl ester carboxylesterase